MQHSFYTIADKNYIIHTCESCKFLGELCNTVPPPCSQFCPMKIPFLSGLSPKNWWPRTRAMGRLLRLAAEEFNADNGLKLAASLSYYTLFSMAPMLLIVIAIGSILLGKEAASGYLFQQFEGLLGAAGAVQLQEMINNVRISGDTPWVTAVGIITDRKSVV